MTFVNIGCDVKVNDAYTVTMNSLQVTCELGRLCGLEGESTLMVTCLWLGRRMRAGTTSCHHCLSIINLSSWV